MVFKMAGGDIKLPFKDHSKDRRETGIFAEEDVEIIDTVQQN